MCVCVCVCMCVCVINEGRESASGDEAGALCSLTHMSVTARELTHRSSMC